MVAPSVPSAQAAMVGKVIDNGSLRLLKIVGCGGFGTVFSALDIQSVQTRDAKLRAVKIMASKPRSRARQTQRKELYYHRKVSHHPNIVTVHHAFYEDKFCYIVLDMISGGDLFTAIRDKATYPDEEELTRRVFIQLIDAVAFCHSLGVSHRDIKPENIMCSADGRNWYLSDFGLASDTGECTSFEIGSIPYSAPEIINDDGLYEDYLPSLGDVWAIGIVFIAVLTSCGPWKAAKHSDSSYAHYYRHRSRTLSKILPLTKTMSKLVSRILDPAPEARISLSELRDAIEQVDRFYPYEFELRQAEPGPAATMNRYMATRDKRMAKEKRVPKTLLSSVPALSSAPENVKMPLRVPQAVLPSMSTVESRAQRPRLIGLGLFRAAPQSPLSPFEHKQVKPRADAAPLHITLHQNVAGSESSSERSSQTFGHDLAIAQDGFPPNAPFPSPPMTPLDFFPMPMPLLSSTFLSAPDSASISTGPVTPHAQSLLSVNIVPGARSVESRITREVDLTHVVVASPSADPLSTKTRRLKRKFLKNIFAKLRLK